MTNSLKDDFMREALRLASDSVNRGGGPFGAVVVRDCSVIGRGTNEVVRRRDPSAHAEIVAIREACRSLQSHVLSGCELYCSCEPCPMCLSAAYWSRLDRIFYAATRQDAAAAGFDDAFLYAELTKPMSARKLSLFRLLGNEGGAPFRQWQESPSKIPY